MSQVRRAVGSHETNCRSICFVKHKYFSSLIDQNSVKLCEQSFSFQFSPPVLSLSRRRCFDGCRRFPSTAQRSVQTFARPRACTILAQLFVSGLMCPSRIILTTGHLTTAVASLAVSPLRCLLVRICPNVLVLLSFLGLL